LEEEGYPEKVYIIGLEFTKEVIPAIKEGKIDMTTDYSISGVGYKAVEAAVKHLKGEEIPSYIPIEPVIVDKNNVDEITPEM